MRNLRLALTSGQWMILVAIVLLALLGFGYIERTTEQLAAQAELEQWEARVQEAKAQRERLEKELAYVQTDDYIDRQARTIFGWVRPGETPVEVIIEEPPATSAQPAGQPAQVKRPWQAWWDLFFGR